MIRLSFSLALIACLCLGCGDKATPTSPSLPPSLPSVQSPTTVTIRGQITDTITGAVVGSFTTEAPRVPAQVTISAPGYITRQTWVESLTPRVDLFPERGFDLAFYQQFARDNLDRHSGGLQPLMVLQQAPAFYMEVEGPKGLSRQVVTRLEAVARRVVPAMTGGRFQVTRWETGPTPRAPVPGWITIERRDDPDACGRAVVGASAGQIWMNADPGCRVEATFAHEIGHAFGFFHVNRPGSMMETGPDKWRRSAADAPTDHERHHATLAYARRRGNTDVDIDALTPLPLTTYVVME